MSQHSVSDANSYVFFFPLLEYMEAEDCHIFQVRNAQKWVLIPW